MLSAARRWKFFDPVYMAQFYVYRCAYPVFVADLKRRCKIEQSDRVPGGKALCHLLPNGDRIYILWVPANNRARTSAHIGVVAHEALHLAMDVLMTRGLNADVDHQEPYTYYLEWLLVETLKRLRR